MSCVLDSFMMMYFMFPLSINMALEVGLRKNRMRRVNNTAARCSDLLAARGLISEVLSKTPRSHFIWDYSKPYEFDNQHGF